MSIESVGNLQKILDTTLGSFLDLVQCDAQNLPFPTDPSMR